MSINISKENDMKRSQKKNKHSLKLEFNIMKDFYYKYIGLFIVYSDLIRTIDTKIDTNNELLRMKHIFYVHVYIKFILTLSIILSYEEFDWLTIFYV